MKKISMTIMVCATFCATTASAQSIQQTNAHQNARIRQGVRSGSITKNERIAIARQQQDAYLATQVAKSDGVISPGEKRIIKREQRQTSRVIYRKKHNSHSR